VDAQFGAPIGTIATIDARRPPRVVGGMAPAPRLLADVLPTERLNERGVLRRPARDELRRIPTARNAVAVAGAVAQTYGVMVAAAVVDRWWAWLAAFVWMGRGHALLNILGHEAAHRLLFRRQRVNDAVGRWVLAYPTLQPLAVYRRSHFAHHRDEMGPGEPDLGLYAGYPVPQASWWRKLRRDATGVSGAKNLRALARAARGDVPDAMAIVAVQAGLLLASIAAGVPLAYAVWLGSWCTLWKVSNRLRAVAEHGGMERSGDRRRTTHVIRQSRAARLALVPYHTGWHLAHHVDMGVPWTNLPRLHAELVAAGWVTPEIEYPSYRAFWRAARRG
jgi:fatty acid desaturase